MARMMPRPRNGRWSSSPIPVPMATVNTTPNNAYQPVFSTLVRTWALLNNCVKLPNPTKWSGGVNTSEWKKASMIVSTVG